MGEATIIRNDEATNLPPTPGCFTSAITTTTTAAKPAYQTIFSNSAPNGVQQGQGVDPLNTSYNPNINWSTSTTDTKILFMLTEASTTSDTGTIFR